MIEDADWEFFDTNGYVLLRGVLDGDHLRRIQEAFDEVYLRRIVRGNEFFSTKKLGAFGADLAGLAQFFDSPWRWSRSPRWHCRRSRSVTEP